MSPHDLNDTLSRPMPLPTPESVDSQKIREVKIRSHAPAKGKPQAQNENVLENLRSGWVSEHEAALPGKRPGPAARRPGASHPLQLIASELRLFFQAVAEMLRELLRSIARGAREVLKTDGTGPALVGLLAVVIVIGGLVYIALVDRIFEQGQPPAVATVDTSAATAPPAVPPAPVTAENAPVAATPAATEAASNDHPASALLTSAPQNVAAPPAFGGFVRLPADLTKSDGTSPLDGSSPSTDGGDLVGLANSHTEEAIARKAHDAPTQRDSGATASSNTAHATPVSRASPPATAEQRPAGYAPSVTAGTSGARTTSAPASQAARPIVATDARTLARLEAAQRKAARAGNSSQVESTAVAAIAHGGQAVFDVRHVRATNGEACPARIVVTAATLAFLPDASCETGAFTIPLASVNSVEAVTAQSTSANLLSIEYSVPGKRGSRERLRLEGPRMHGASAAQVAPVTPIRNVIVAVQRPAAR